MKLAHLFLSVLFTLMFFIVNSQELHNAGEYQTEEISVWFPGTGMPQNITVDVIDGHYIYAGDIIVKPFRYEDKGRGGATMITDSINQSYKWPNSTIPYVLPNDIVIKETIEWAIEQLNTRTNLCLIPKSSTHTSWIKFNCRLGVGGGSSELGRQKGEQLVNIGETADRGTSIHEIMHAAGFYHEQNRLDRDSFVDINLDNIKSGKCHNFDRLDDQQGGQDLGEYDYGSLMHYPSKAFGIDDPSDTTGNTRLVTIKTKNGASIGQRRDLSAGDIASINLVYSSCSSLKKALVYYSEPSNAAAMNKPNFLKEYWGIGWSLDDDGRGGTGTAINFNIQYDVELVPQQSGMSCWAAAASMIVGWIDEVCINPEEIANAIDYWAQYQQGMELDDHKMFKHWYLKTEPPMSYTPREFVNLLAGYGPLWIGTAEGNSAHARVVAGASGDGSPEGTVLTIYDPWQTGMTKFRSNNTGSVYQETFAEFERKNHALAKAFNYVKQTPIFVAHN